MAADRTKARIFSNTAWLATGMVLNTLIGLYITRALARYLGVADYGLYTLAFVYLNFTAVIANFGFDAILWREAARDKENTDALLTTGIVLKLIFAVPAVMAGALYLFWRGFPPAYTGAVILLLLTHFIAAFETCEIAHRARLWGSAPAVASVTSQTLTLGVVLYGRARGWPLELLIASHILVRMVRAAFLYLSLRARIPVRWRWDRGRALFILRESAVIGLTGVLWVIYFRVDSLMLEWMKGAEAVGQYAAAYKFVDLSLLGSGLLLASLGPLLAERWPANPESFHRLFQQTVDYMAAASTLMAGILVVFSADLIRLIFSPAFTEGIAILRILALAAPVIFLANAFAHVMIVTGTQGAGFMTTRVTAALLNVLLNFWWIPRYGGQGAALATVLSEVTVLLISPAFILRKTGILPRFWVPMLGAAGIGLAWLAYRATGGAPEAATWPARLAGGAVLAAGVAGFLFARRRHLAELYRQLRNRPAPSPEMPPAAL